MPNDTVTTVFDGDDSTFQAAARKVKEAVTGLVAFGGSMKFFENAQKGAKGLHDSTQLAEQGVKSLTAAFGPLIAMGAALVGVASVFEAIKRSIELAAKVETAEFHLSAIAGGADKAAASIKRLHEIGDETATGFGTLAEGSIRLQEAGESADQAAESMGKLQKIALNSGSDVNELGEIYARVLTKADVSSKDLVKLAMTGIPGIKAISEEYKNLERNTASANLKIDQTIQAMNRLYEKTEKQTSSVNSFGSKIGLMQASFAGWAKSGGSAISGLIKSLDGVGEAGIGKMSGTFGKEFSQGLKQIEVESGLTGTALRRFLAEGKIGYEDLIAAATRFREEEHKAADAKAEAEKLANQNALLVKQRSLLDDVRKAIDTATKPGGIFASVDAFFQTFNGKWQQVQHSIDGMFKNFGAPLIDALKPALDDITAFFSGPGKAAAVEWGGKLGSLIKDAMKALTTGDWGPLEKDGVAAFAAIIKAAQTGLKDLGAILKGVFSGSEALGAVKAFGDVLNDVMQIAVDSFFTALQKKFTLHLFMSDDDIKKADQAEQDKRDGKGPKPDANTQYWFMSPEDIAKAKEGKPIENANLQKLQDDLAKLVTKSSVLGTKVGDDLSQANSGKPADMDQSTWDMYYKPLSSRAAPPERKTETAAPPEEANRDKTNTTASPLATAASTAVDAGTATTPAAASGTGFKPFQAPTVKDGSAESSGGSGSAGGSGGKSGSETGGWKDPDPNWSPAGANPNDPMARQLSESHYTTLAGLGMSPIGDDTGGPIDPNGKAPSRGFTQSGGYYYASEHGGKTWDESYGGMKGASKGGSAGTNKVWMGSDGVEHSATGAVGPGGMPPWSPPPASDRDKATPGSRLFGPVRTLTDAEANDPEWTQGQTKEQAANNPFRDSAPGTYRDNKGNVHKVDASGLNEGQGNLGGNLMTQDNSGKWQGGNFDAIGDDIKSAPGSTNDKKMPWAPPMFPHQTADGQGLTGFPANSVAGNAGQAGISPTLPAPGVAATPGNIAQAPAAAAPAASPAAAMATGIATVMAKLDALIAAINKEGGFLEKVLSGA